jgi:hypothetical protein
MLLERRLIADRSLASEPLIITEGELDAIIAVQCGFPRTVSIPDGAPAQAQGPADHRLNLWQQIDFANRRADRGDG